MEAGTDAAQPAGSPVRNGRNRSHPSSAQQSVPCRTTSYTPHKGRIKVWEVSCCCLFQWQPHHAICITCIVESLTSLSHLQDVEVAPGNPNQFWSASEDGSIREYDKRCTCAFST